MCLFFKNKFYFISKIISILPLSNQNYPQFQSFNNNGSRFRRPGGLSSGVGLTKLIIANLDFGVTDSDIKVFNLKIMVKSKVFLIINRN